MTARARAAKAPRAESPPDAATKPDAVTAEIAPPAETTPDAPTKPDATAELKTRAKALQEGQSVYWRGGQAHTKEWQTWPAGAYSAEQIERLETDERVEVEAIQA